MKTESFNLNINALDDKVLYKVICKKIRESEAFSFKLLWWVPLLSGLIITGFLVFGNYLAPWITLVCALFGAGVTYSIFRWEKRNMQDRQTYREYAEILEAKKMQLEEGEENDTVYGPFTLLSKSAKPHFWGRKESDKGWGKFEAATAIYALTIVFWMGMATASLIN